MVKLRDVIGTGLAGLYEVRVDPESESESESESLRKLATPQPCGQRGMLGFNSLALFVSELF